ncbi:GNAT family N-acetyltransferase [Dawidia soli]|uniref:GNAT family N-acetyltransferase n=1 Tax=Dawidia soli TaxID=2782352 RepID=A0AAP2D6V4_9BACT|nr:GNAT family N-acetyltransferase [Dawidia soli]MBT1686174.1 GNAT family N-acetyltransferase [Dawidia soli]
MGVSISLFERSHWAAVSEIYGLGIATGNATFETTVPDFDSWLKKFHAHLLWVAIDNGVVVGWAGLQPVSVREVYRGVVEVTIYVHPGHAGKGIGTTLMRHLVEQSEAAGIWTLYASIFPENTASIKLHEAAGFREIGYRERIAQMDGKWRNTVLFERRSEIVGI